MQIEKITDLTDSLSQLTELLCDGVESGASIGFLPPLAQADAEAYWQDVQAQINEGMLLLYVARTEQRIIGSVQLALCGKANGRHRGEVQKLMVHTKSRQQGAGRKLMTFIEQEARSMDLSLLVLDTRVGDVASILYRRLGFVEAGQIPDFALSANGQYDPTVYFYKHLLKNQQNFAVM